MDRLSYLTYGGNGIEAEDFEWLQNATLKSFKELLKGFGLTNTDTFIIYGCEVTGGNHAGGAVVIAGEILPVVPAALPALNPGEVYQFQILEVPDPSGLEPLESGGTTNQYLIRTAVVVSAPSGTGLALISKRLHDQEDWHIVGDPGEPAFENGADGSFLGSFLRRLRFRKTKDGRVELSGIVRVPAASISAGLSIFHLPAGYIPNGGVAVATTYQEFPASNPALAMQPSWLNVNTRGLGTGTNDGKVWLTNLQVPPAGGDAILYLDGISFTLQ